MIRSSQYLFQKLGPLLSVHGVSPQVFQEAYAKSSQTSRPSLALRTRGQKGQRKGGTEKGGTQKGHKVGHNGKKKWEERRGT
jgi:hypothetical protein